MSTSAAPLAAVRTALSGLIDYAGLFPPAQLRMAPSAAEYAAARKGPFSWMLGRFIVPASRIEELREALPGGEAPFALSVILDAGRSPGQLASVKAVEGMRLEALEAPLAAADIADAAAALRKADLTGVPAYMEWPRTGEWQRELPAVMSSLAEHGLCAKIRCGGLEQRAFPEPREIAAFIAAAQSAGVRYKATAGLHHPIRHFNAPTGLMMHGFLNLLFAAVLAHQGAGAEELEACLACEDRGAFRFEAGGLRWNGRRAGVPEIEAARRSNFAGYGSCSVAEPVEDLQAMGVL